MLQGLDDAELEQLIEERTREIKEVNARLTQEIAEHRYDIIGISAIMPNLGKVEHMCRLIRAYQPQATIVVGGHVAGIGGIEFSTVFRGIEVHLLGYGLPLDDPKCSGFLERHREYLIGRCRETIAKLANPERALSISSRIGAKACWAIGTG